MSNSNANLSDKMLLNKNKEHLLVNSNLNMKKTAPITSQPISTLKQNNNLKKSKSKKSSKKSLIILF